MNGLALAAVTGGALSALTLGFPTQAWAAPSGVGSAQDTIDELQRDGYRVTLYKIGAAPLDRCTVASVRARPAAPATVLLTARC
ncbi:hypothetical protein M1247_29165 [Mycobacterium sp. 21AC1]|uniref:hypothetical protein n=1 Tax=[Mycobacterium] appelbergii TaxID=2939269 RepID=UPI0029393604|nr:hypothetical protein [Mycobacterium sp. 21AC1]MDV3129007.1 hypothetical protein [Mycobacterium sp. 21AC1]